MGVTRPNNAFVSYCQTSVWMPREVKPALKTILMSKGLTMSQFFNVCALALVTKDIKLKKIGLSEIVRHQSLAELVNDPRAFFNNLGCVLTDSNGEMLSKTTLEAVIQEDGTINHENLLDEEDA